MAGWKNNYLCNGMLIKYHNNKPFFKQVKIKTTKVMKRKILFLSGLILSVSTMFAQLDFSNTEEISRSLLSYDYTYTGSHQGVNILVFETVSNQPLTQGEDYEISYQLNGETVQGLQDAGVYTITVTGTEPAYTGSFTETLTVNKADLATVLVSGVGSSYPYIAAQIQPAIGTVTFNSMEVAGDEYTLSYGENTNVSTGGTIVLTATVDGNFQGTKAVAFTIAAVTLTADMIQPIPDQDYTGSNINPDVIVKIGDAVVPATNYVLFYLDSQNGAYINVGTYNVTVSPALNLTGNAIVVPFQIIDSPTGLLGETMSAVKLSTSGNILSIKSDDAVSVSVYNLLGQLKYQSNVNVTDTTISLDKGIYLVKAGEVISKIVIR